MSLNWDLRKIHNNDELWDEIEEDGEKRYTLKPVTNALIWSTLHVNLSGITEETADLFYERLHMYETFLHTMLIAKCEETGEVKKRFITKEEVERHIGLNVNVSDMTQAKWKTWFFKCLINEMNSQDVQRKKEESDDQKDETP